MRFPGYWLTRHSDHVTVASHSFDDTDLSQKSNWTEAHQNEDPEYPAGYVKAGLLLAEVVRALHEINPDVFHKVEDLEDNESVLLDIKTVEDLGRLCIHLAPELFWQTKHRK